MEHLMIPAERVSRRDGMPTVPWLGFEHNIAQGFPVAIAEYPLLRGWTTREIQLLRNGKLGGRDPIQVLAMIQSWMFLGLLEAFFRESFDSKEFITNDADGAIVNTSYLRDFLDSYHLRVREHSNSSAEWSTRWQTAVETLREAKFWNQRLIELTDHRGGPKPFANVKLSDPVMRFTTLVAEALWALAQQFPSLERRPFISCDWLISPGNDMDLRNRVKSRGWCPTLYDKVKKLLRTPSSFFEYVSLYSPFQESPKDHQNCLSNRCVEYNVDEMQYSTKHFRNGCNCRLIKPPLEAVKRSLGRSEIPLMNGDDLLFSNTTTVATYSDKNFPVFVAFSHVWSDGLGSSTEKGLPECQIRYLRDTAQEAAKTSLFWIDSLCIPKDRDTRKCAISLMAKTYKSAIATVVLDSGIKRCHQGMSLEVIIVALSLSMWQQRLWTLQESSLSQCLYFQFEDGLVESGIILEQTSQNLHRPIVRAGHLLLDNLTGWVNTTQVTVGGLQRNLYYRISSKLDDECLAVAPFLNLNVESLQEVDGEARMIRFWSMVQRVPKSIIIHDAPKISRNGYRWAPRSIMDQNNDTIMDFLDDSVEVTPIGLKGSFLVYTLQLPGSLISAVRIPLYNPETENILFIGGAIDGVATFVGLLSRNHVIALTDPLNTSTTDQKLGVVLSKSSDAAASLPQQTPVYRYEGLIQVGMVPKASLIPDPMAFPYENIGNHLTWITHSFHDLVVVASGMLKRMLIGGLRVVGMAASGALTEIIIC